MLSTKTPAANISAAAHAQAIWRKQIDRLGLQFKIHWHGLGQWQTAFCFLEKQGQAQEVALDLGKGLNPLQTELSACYEALENYLSYQHQFSRRIECVSVKAIRERYITTPFRFHKRLLNSRKNTVLPWVIATELIKAPHHHTQQQAAFLLATLDCQYNGLHLTPPDTYDYSKHACYASTNGLASAATYEDAIIHGIAEVIERDAISYFLLDTFLLKQPLQLIRKNTLPTYLQTLIKKLEITYQEDIFILHLPSRFNVPVYGAVFTRQKQIAIPPKGFGASLNAAYAIERAVLEALQSLHLNEYMPEKCVDLNMTPLREYPILLDCLRYNIMSVVEENCYQWINFNSSETLSELLDNSSKMNTLNNLIEKIKKQQLSIYINDIVRAENGFSCVNVIIPKTDEFFHVFNECIILPQEETINYVKEKNREKKKIVAHTSCPAAQPDAHAH